MKTRNVLITITLSTAILVGGAVVCFGQRAGTTTYTTEDGATMQAVVTWVQVSKSVKNSRCKHVITDKLSMDAKLGEIVKQQRCGKCGSVWKYRKSVTIKAVP